MESDPTQPYPINPKGELLLPGSEMELLVWQIADELQKPGTLVFESTEKAQATFDPWQFEKSIKDAARNERNKLLQVAMGSRAALRHIRNAFDSPQQPLGSGITRVLALRCRLPQSETMSESTHHIFITGNVPDPNAQFSNSELQYLEFFTVSEDDPSIAKYIMYVHSNELNDNGSVHAYSTQDTWRNAINQGNNLPFIYQPNAANGNLLNPFTMFRTLEILLNPNNRFVDHTYTNKIIDYYQTVRHATFIGQVSDDSRLLLNPPM